MTTENARTQDAGDTTLTPDQMPACDHAFHRYGQEDQMSDEQRGEIMRGIAKRVSADEDAPCQPILWKVLIKPLPPREKTKGGIMLPDEVRDAEEQLTCVAEVVRMGGLAFQAQTKAGLDLSREVNRPKIGSWVLCFQYAGQKIWVDDVEYRLLNDTDIMAVTETPDVFRNYI